MTQLVVVVLNRAERLEDLLAAFADHGIRDATILESTGMARVLSHSEYTPLFGSLRMMFNPERQESKTIFTVLEEEQIPQVRAAFQAAVGDLNAPNTGILFALPVSFTEGIGGAPHAE